MATLTIRNVDAAVKARLRVRAARHGHSMEAEARTILSEAVAAESDESEPNLAEAIVALSLTLTPDELHALDAAHPLPNHCRWPRIRNLLAGIGISSHCQ